MWGQVILYFVYMGIPSRDKYDQKTSQTPSEETIIGYLCFKYFFFFAPLRGYVYRRNISIFDLHLVSILAWKIPRTEEPGGLQSTGSQRIRND